MNKKRKEYISPELELVPAMPLRLLSGFSAGGDINDYEEGGDYEGNYVDPID